MLSTSVFTPHLSLPDTKCSSKAVYKIFCWPSKSCNSLQTVIKCQPLSGAWLTSLWKTQVSSTPTPIFLAQKCLHPLSRFKNIPSPHLFFSDLSPKSLIRQCSLWDIYLCVCVCENDGEGVFLDIPTRLFCPAGSTHTHTHTHLIHSEDKKPFKSPIPLTETHALWGPYSLIIIRHGASIITSVEECGTTGHTRFLFSPLLWTSLLPSHLFRVFQYPALECASPSPRNQLDFKLISIAVKTQSSDPLHS